MSQDLKTSDWQVIVNHGWSRCWVRTRHLFYFGALYVLSKTGRRFVSTLRTEDLVKADPVECSAALIHYTSCALLNEHEDDEKEKLDQDDDTDESDFQSEVLTMTNSQPQKSSETFQSVCIIDSKYKRLKRVVSLSLLRFQISWLLGVLMLQQIVAYGEVLLAAVLVRAFIIIHLCLIWKSLSLSNVKPSRPMTWTPSGYGLSLSIIHRYSEQVKFSGLQTGKFTDYDLSVTTNPLCSFPDVPMNEIASKVSFSSNTNFSGENNTTIYWKSKELISDRAAYDQFQWRNTAIDGKPHSVVITATTTKIVSPIWKENNFIDNRTCLQTRVNGLSGMIPSDHFQDLNNLISVDLGFNSFNGSIPSSLFSLQLLQQIKVSSNDFEGFLPNFSNPSLISLDTLDLSGQIIKLGVNDCDSTRCFDRFSRHLTWVRYWALHLMNAQRDNEEWNASQATPAGYTKKIPDGFE
ncbi:leucine-rich repeat-containing protein [Tanacetum coccineum]|uniref:Leucine-rich repeat-containing protein n=1 Tax=Tanacetum coccineum TaxID=301880 RepID=A0ABQ5FBA2_9ASTR